MTPITFSHFKKLKNLQSVVGCVPNFVAELSLFMFRLCHEPRSTYSIDLQPHFGLKQSISSGTDLVQL